MKTTQNHSLNALELSSLQLSKATFSIPPPTPHPPHNNSAIPSTPNMNCTTLTSRTSFESYITLLQTTTSNNLTLISQCRKEICGALWGAGNPDVSGIGMAIGYLLESCICILVLCAFTWVEGWTPKTARLARMLVANTSRAFYDNAVFFTFAIQAASIATLTRVDFGISADGMGALTMQITWLVSMLTLLPLLPLVLRPQIYLGNESGAGDDGERGKSALVRRSAGLKEARQDLRFLFFVICWAMAFCPFFSRMGAAFGRLDLISLYSGY